MPLPSYQLVNGAWTTTEGGQNGWPSSVPAALPKAPQPIAAQRNMVWPQSSGFGDAGTQQWQAQQAAFGAQQQANQARTMSINAQGVVNQANSAYIQQQQQGLQLRQQEEAALEAARNNVPGITAAATINRDRANQNYRYAESGLQAPADVALPDGVQAQGTGVRTMVMSPEERTNYNYKAPLAQSELATEGSRLLTSRASNAANAVQLDEQRAGVGLADATLNLKRTMEPPAPGLVYDETTGNFMDRGQAAINQYKQRPIYDPVSGTFTNQEDLRSRTDKYGNVKRTTDGVLVSPEGNEFIDGAWHDPKTGNVYDPQAKTWSNPDGNVYHVTNPKTNAGVWTTNDGGMYLGEGGIWRNSVTGQPVVRVLPGGQTTNVSPQAVARAEQAQYGGGSQFAALPTAALLNTIPSSGGALYTQPVIAELARRLMGPPSYYNVQQAEAAAQELVQQELASRKKTGYDPIP